MGEKSFPLCWCGKQRWFAKGRESIWGRGKAGKIGIGAGWGDLLETFGGEQASL